MVPEGIIALAVAGVLILLVVGFILAYNRLQRLAVKVEEAGSGIDVALEKRCDRWASCWRLSRNISPTNTRL